MSTTVFLSQPVAAEGFLTDVSAATRWRNVWTGGREVGVSRVGDEKRKEHGDRRVKLGRGGPGKAVAVETDEPAPKDFTPTPQETVRRTSCNGSLVPDPPCTRHVSIVAGHRRPLALRIVSRHPRWVVWL